jgi:fucose permease
VLLMVFAAGLLADTVENLQQLGWLPVLATVVVVFLGVRAGTTRRASRQQVPA